MNQHIALLTCGPPEHGIVRFGRELAGAVGDMGFSGAILHEPDPRRLADAVQKLPPDIRLVHLQANDWLFTDRAHRADETVAALATELRARGACLSLTLHDLPHQAVTRELLLRRARSYAHMMVCSVGVVVASEHERALIAESLIALDALDRPESTREMPAVEVIPLPVGGYRPGRVRIRPTYGSRRSVGILGYLYPGKGHLDVLEALSGMTPAVTVLAIGRPSDGHGPMLPELAERGRVLGVPFACTGYVPDDELNRHLQDVSVPVAPALHVSASASINTWLAAGRRPLVVDSRYARELDHRMPGAISIYRPGDLADRVRSALTDPSSTYLRPDHRTHPSRREVASHYLRWLESIASMAVDPRNRPPKP